jgi:hypothetical protein
MQGDRMPIAVQCDCGKHFRAPDEAAGKRVKCSSCGTILNIPTSHVRRDSPAPVQPTVAGATIGRQVSSTTPSRPSGSGRVPPALKAKPLASGAAATSIPAEPPAPAAPSATVPPDDAEESSTRQGWIAIATGVVLVLIGLLATLLPGSNKIYYGAIWVGVESLMIGGYCLIAQVRAKEISRLHHVLFSLAGLVVAGGFIAGTMAKELFGQSFLYTRLILQGPLLAIYLVVFGIAIGLIRRYRLPAKLAVAATGVWLVQGIVNPLFQEMVIAPQWGRGGWQMQLASLSGIVLQATAVCLLFAAAFVGRSPAVSSEA